MGELQASPRFGTLPHWQACFARGAGWGPRLSPRISEASGGDVVSVNLGALVGLGDRN